MSREIVVVWLLIFLLIAGSFFGLYRIRQDTEALRTQIDTVAVRADMDAQRLGNQLETTEDPITDAEGRLEALQSAIETNSVKLNTIGENSQQIASRLDSLENRVAGVEQSNSPLTDRISALEGRIASVETLNGQSSTPEAGIQQIAARLNSLENRIASVEALSGQSSTRESGNQQIAAHLGSLESRMVGIEQSNASVAERMESLNQRIMEVESRLQVENPVILGEDGCVPSEVVTANQLGLCLTSLTARDAVFTWALPGATHSNVSLRRVDGDGEVVASKMFEGTAVSIAALTPQPSDSGTLLFAPEPGARYMLEVQMVIPVNRYFTSQHVFTMPTN